MNAIRCVLGFLGFTVLAGCGGGGGGGGGGGQPDLPLLAQLEVSQGVLAPTFDPSVPAYVVGPAPLSSTVTVTATVADAGATLTVNGVPTASGTPSAPIPLAPGMSVVTIHVTAPNGFTQHAYTVAFDRTSADLASLVASAGPLTPSFSPDETDYAVGPPLAVTSTTITATSADPGATVTIDGLVVPYGESSPVLSLGPHVTTVTVLVVPRAGFTKTYTIVLDRFEAFFLEDFSAPVLGPWWSGTGSLDPAFGSPQPSLALLSSQSVEYVGEAFSTGDGVTMTLDGQWDQFAVLKVNLFDVTDPEDRWLSLELSGNLLHTRYGNNGAQVISSQNPIPPNDFLFHQIEIRVDDMGTALFTLDGTLYAQFNVAIPATDMRFTLSHATTGGGPSTFARFDEIVVTLP